MDNESQAFVGIDIGTSFIKIIAMQAANKKINVVGVGVAQSKGMNKGMVVDIEQTIEDLKDAQADLNKRSKIAIEEVTVGLPTGYLSIQNLKGSLKFSENPREINENDIEQLVSKILNDHRSPDRDFVSIEIVEFIVDNFDGINDPLGMIGTSLTLKCLVYSLPKTIFRNITKCVQGAGFKVKHLVLDSVAISEVALSDDQRKMGSVVIDTGSGKTSIDIFQNNLLVKSDIIYEGGKNVTTDISKILKISEDDAESVKIDYGSLKTSSIQNNDTFVIETLDQARKVEIGDRYLSEIISARFEQIFEKIKKMLGSTDDLDLPGGIIITGGNSALPGTESKISEIIGRQVSIYVPKQIGLRNQIYVAAEGMVIHAWRLSRIQKVLESTLGIGEGLREVKDPITITDNQKENLDHEEKSQPKKIKSQKKKQGGFISSVRRWLYNLFE